MEWRMEQERINESRRDSDDAIALQFNDLQTKMFNVTKENQTIEL